VKPAHSALGAQPGTSSQVDSECSLHATGEPSQTGAGGGGGPESSTRGPPPSGLDGASHAARDVIRISEAAIGGMPLRSEVTHVDRTFLTSDADHTHISEARWCVSQRRQRPVEPVDA
jgi:hypothetical protein